MLRKEGCMLVALTTKGMQKLLDDCGPQVPMLLMSSKRWRKERSVLGIFAWTEDDLSRAKQHGGYIGTKYGVPCYRHVMISESAEDRGAD